MKVAKKSEWELHASGCAACESVDVSDTKTLARCCNKGAPMLRDYLARKNAKPSVPRDDKEKKAPVYVVKERQMVEKVFIEKGTKKEIKEMVWQVKIVSPQYRTRELANEFLALAQKTMGGDPARFFATEK